MQIAKEWSGFTGGQADTLRKAVGKKNIALMQKVKPEFVEGAVKVGGAKKEIAETFWDQLEEFANYCFNKSHAACYGLISYWTAYLKAHYPDAFMAALMTSDQDDTERLAIEMTECRHMGLSVLSPDVNESFVEFAVVPKKKQIRFGLAAVKGVGVGAVEEILRARDESPFASIEDFATRVSTSKVNKKSWESLIKAGAFDTFGDRSDLLFNLEDILAFASKLQKERLSGQVDLFGQLVGNESVRAKLELRTAPVKYTEKEQLMWERELMGLYISAHPLDKYDAFFDEQTIPMSQVSPKIDGQEVTVGGLVTTLRSIVTKSGKKMAFIGIEAKTGECEIIVFPNLYDQIGSKLSQDMVIKATGKVSARDRDGNMGDEAKLIADQIDIISDKELREYESTGRKMAAPTSRAPYRKKVYPSASASVDKPKASYTSVATDVPSAVQLQTLYLRVEDPSNTQTLLILKTLCGKFPGSSDVVLVLGDDKKALKMPFRVEASDALIGGLVKAIGEDAVVMK